MYRALRVQTVDGCRVMPGDHLPAAHKWKHKQLLIDTGYIEEVSEVPPDTELENLRTEAKELGISGYARMKKETLVTRIEESKQQAEG